MLGKLLATGSILFFISVFSLGHSSALEGQNIGISPSITNKTLDAGSVYSNSLIVTNNGSVGYNYTIYASPYGVKNPSYQPVFKKLPGFTNISNWFTFSTSSGYLNPHQTISVAYSINIPAHTPPESYYAAVFAQTGSSSAQTPNKTQVDFNQRVGSLFYINVNGQATQDGRVDSWSVPFFQSTNVYGSLKLRNTGKLYFVSTVNVSFKDLLGNVKYQYQTQKIVIPQVIRNIQPVWPKPPAFGIYKVNGTATVYGQKYLTTRYVLIVAPNMRLVFIFIVVAIIIYLSIHNVLVNLYKSKSDDKK